MRVSRLIAVGVATGAGIALALVARPSDAASAYTITGSATGLYPGASVPMVITITSVDAKPIRVSSITATFKTGVVGCEPSRFTLGRLTQPVLVPARGRATVTLPVALAKSAPSKCANQKATVTFTSVGSY